jgi:L-aspartate oxidase
MIETDFLIIGSGISGLLAAIKLAARGSVAIVTKKNKNDSNTNYAQGGIAVALDEGDSRDLHVADTLMAGGGLCDENVVRHVVGKARECIDDLRNMGVPFSTEDVEGGKQRISLGREGGHSARRIAHVKDYTGRAIEEVLLETARATGRVAFYENHLAIDLILESRRSGTPLEPDRCWGAYVMDEEVRSAEVFLAKATILATGGAGKVYRYTSNPDIATGDGVAMAWRAKARIANLEFVQFHPTCLYHPEAKSFLISEAVRGEGAVLTTAGGEAFMKRHDERGDLAPRDIVARAVDFEMKRTGDKYVHLDMRPIGDARIKERFPYIYSKCVELGIDPVAEPLWVVPAAHYMCGGVVTDIRGRTNIDGLLAAGEVAHTGFHGANRLASNSLLEAVVFADSVAECAIETAAAFTGDIPRVRPWVADGTTAAMEEVVFDHDWDSVRSIMWDYVGIVRSDERLSMARKRIEVMREHIEAFYRKYRLNPDLIELRNIALVGELIIRCAQLRRESRGLHYNVDCAETDDAGYKRDTVVGL